MLRVETKQRIKRGRQTKKKQRKADTRMEVEGFWSEKKRNKDNKKWGRYEGKERTRQSLNPLHLGD